MKTQRSVRLVYANRDIQSVIFAAELDRLAAKHAERLAIVQNLDDRDGFLTAERVKEHVADRSDADFYLCGPGAFMEIVENGIEAAGISREHVFKEVFVSLDDDEPSEADRERAAEADAGAVGCETLVVTVDGVTHEISYVEGKTVLETAREAGVEPPYSCEDGYCSCCMAKLLEGQVKMRKNDCLTQRDLDDGWVLTCQSIPQTPTVKVDWDAS